MIESRHESIASIGSMVFFSVLAGAVFAVLPLFVGTLIDLVGLTPAQAGWVAAAEMLGASIAALGASLIISLGNWRAILTLGTVALATADAVTPVAHHFPLLFAIRLLGGVGEGVLLAISNACIGETRNPDRVFGFSSAGQLAFGAVGLYLLPQILRTYGLHGLFWLFAAITLSALALVRHIPDRPQSAGEEAYPRVGILLSQRSVIGLLGVFTYFVAQGAVWTYFDRIGVANGIAVTQVASALAISSIAGILGASLSSYLGVTYGRLRPLFICTLCTVVSLLVLNDTTTFGVFAILASIFNFAWNASVPYQFGILAEIDASRRTVALGGAVVFAGLTAGPAIAASIITNGRFQAVAWLGMGFCIMSILFFTRLLIPLEQSRLERS